MKRYRERNQGKHVVVMVAALVFTPLAASLVSCKMTDRLGDAVDTAQNTTQSAEAVLQDALDRIDQNSAAWQQVLREAQGKLTADTQSTIRNELNDILQRGIAASGAEFRCNTDFIAGRVRAALQRLLAKVSGRPAPPVIPGLCNVVPLAVDMALVPGRLNSVAFYGYDFDRGQVRAKLINHHAQRDVTAYLSKPTHYHMVMNLGGNGVPLTSKSQKIQLLSGRQVLSEIPVIQPTTPVCKSRVVTFQPGTMTYMPPHVRGDRQFAGHGPRVVSTVKLLPQGGGSRIDVRLSMTAKETKKDWTTASGSVKRVLYNAPHGWKIESVEGAKQLSHQYLDGDHTDDVFDFGAGELVKRIVYRGDGKGQDAGVYTQMTVTFNPLRIHLSETGNCVPPSTIRSLEKARMISPERLRALKLHLNLAPMTPIRP